MELQPPLVAPIIARLPEVLINQIAAGEVIERPSSVIKELVENSIDAGSRRIEVDLREGGIQEITVIDDGFGMVPADLERSIERHATSKIRAAADLEAIASFGFRGEALSSIASVSRMDISSRTAQAPGASALTMEFGVVKEGLHPIGGPVGTRITVRELFSLLPARQKFLRSAATEFSHCAKILRELALGSPQTAFFLHHQGKRVARYLARERETRFAEAFRVQWPPLAILEEGPGVRLEAWLSPPDWTQERGEILLYINQRAVKNRTLVAAVRNAYLSTLGPHHEPSGVLYLDIRKDWVDVNVHPQKMEVRCLRQETLYPWLLASVRKAIGRAVPVPSPRIREVEPPATAIPDPTDGTPDSAAPLHDRTFSDMATPVARSAGQSVPASAVVSGHRPAWEENRPFRILGNLKSRYLIGEDTLGLVVIDPCALCERILYLEMNHRRLNHQTRVRRLSVPKVFRLPLDLSPLFEQNAGRLAPIGFEVEAFGDGDLAMKGFPEGLSELGSVEALLGVLRAWAELGPADSANSERAAQVGLAEIAMRGTSRETALADAQAFLRENPCPDPSWVSPRGRQILYRVDFGILDKHFERTRPATGEFS